MADILTNSWVDEFAEDMAAETLKLIKASSKSKGDKVSKELSVQFIKYLTHLVILDTLNEYKKKKLSSKKAYEFTHKNFTDLKLQLSHALAESFEKSFEVFSNRYVEYYVAINPVPNPVNKEPI